MHERNAKDRDMKKLTFQLPVSKPKLVHYVAVGLEQWQELPEPVMSDQVLCPVCQGKEHASVGLTSEGNSKLVRICIEADCEYYKKKSGFQATYPLTSPKRSLLWPLFCEYNGIGDLHHGLNFESVEQSVPKIEFMKEFCAHPSGIVHMQGKKGTGKTYCAMAMCQLFTRTDASCRFMTQTDLKDKWLAVVRGDDPHFTEKILTCKLLVIDDFGIGDVSPAFMAFFMTVIDKRMQWSDRGTVITTNLTDDKFSEYCGEPLSDRIKTGQLMEFLGTKSRRKKAI